MNKFEKLNGSYNCVFLIDNVISLDPDGGYQIASGLTYLEPGLPNCVELLDSDGTPIGEIIFEEEVVNRIKLSLVSVNTIFEFSPREN